MTTELFVEALLIKLSPFVVSKPGALLVKLPEHFFNATF